MNSDHLFVYIIPWFIGFVNNFFEVLFFSYKVHKNIAAILICISCFISFCAILSNLKATSTHCKQQNQLWCEKKCCSFLSIIQKFLQIHNVAWPCENSQQFIYNLYFLYQILLFVLQAHVYFSNCVLITLFLAEFLRQCCW